MRIDKRLLIKEKIVLILPRNISFYVDIHGQFTVTQRGRLVISSKDYATARRSVTSLLK